MARIPIDENLAKIPLFRELSRAQLRSLSSISTPLSVHAGRVLMREGEPGRELVIVVDGEVEVHKDGVTIGTRGPGEYYGEISLLLDRPRSATIVAKTDAEIEVIEGNAFAAFLEDNPQLYRPLLHSMGVRLAQLEELAG